MDIRKIIHIDMDAFFASVEIRDNPRLRDKPVVVGGLPGTRSVVCTASYEARKYGIHSAMSSDRAYTLCPNAVFIRPRMEAYKQASAIIRRIFLDYTDLVEPMSIDEAYLDVTVCKKDIPYATRIAREIRNRIRCETGGLTASAGVSFNKFLAKVASDLHKPDGQTVILPEQALDFLAQLPIEKFHGIGRATAKIMHEIGVSNGADLRQKTKLELMQKFGVTGEYYYNIARAIDDREVCPVRERKSLGVEETFLHDLTDVSAMRVILKRQAEEVAQDLHRKKLCGRTITLKVKFFDFRTITRSVSIPVFTASADTIFANVCDLLSKTEAGPTAVRLLGTTVSGFPHEDEIEQLEFEFMKDFRFSRREW